MIWNKQMECADRETMRALQLERLQTEVKYEYEHVPYYAEKMDKAGVKPEDIQTLEDIALLPFLTKEDLESVMGTDEAFAADAAEKLAENAARLKELRGISRCAHSDISCISIYAFSPVFPSTGTSFAATPARPSSSRCSMHQGKSSENK